MKNPPQQVSRRYGHQNPDLKVELENTVHAVDVALDPDEVQPHDQHERRACQKRDESQLRGVRPLTSKTPNADDHDQKHHYRREYDRSAAETRHDRRCQIGQRQRRSHHRQTHARSDLSRTPRRKLKVGIFRHRVDHRNRPNPDLPSHHAKRVSKLAQVVGADDEHEHPRNHQELPQHCGIGR